MERRRGRLISTLVAMGVLAACAGGPQSLGTGRPTSGRAAAGGTPSHAAGQTSPAGAALAPGQKTSGLSRVAGWQAPPPDHWSGHGFDPSNPAGCDPIDPAQCLLPYPNDWFTKPDSSATGRRLDLTLLGMPRNTAGKPIETQEWNRSDGFSAGAQIITDVPGMTKNSDLIPSGLPPVTNLGMNGQKSLGVVLLDTQTGQRWPVWVEIDQYTQEAGVVATGNVQQDLMIHPASNLTDGHRYIVALRNLVKDDGTVAQPSPAFLAYRDEKQANAADPRSAHMENIFATLKQAGVPRRNLYLAWDFTTASTQNVTGRLLAIRDDAFKQLGQTDLTNGKVEGNSPAFNVDSVSNYSPAQNSHIARQVMGHFTVPCYLAPACDPPQKCDKVTGGIVDDCPTPSQFALDPTNPDATPAQTPGQTYQANYICNVGRTAFDNHQKLRPVEYGHGLFGGAREVNSDAETTPAFRFGMMYCATDWTGWATADVPNALIALSDLSRFPLLTDRAQQGELNFLFLARVMVHPKGFSSHPAFQFADGTSFIDTTQPFYDGDSQGGIFGGTVCAVSVDVRRCVLGVSGMDYSILLPRSSDYVAQHPISGIDPTKVPGDPTGQVGYSNVFDTTYPDQSQRILILDLLQTLWDRADPNGYASHMTGGLPNTPAHHVLMQIGYGDHQVANITAEDEARTIGAGGLYPPLVTARYGPYQDPFWNIPAITSFPYDGSAITLFDTGPVRTLPAGCGFQGTDPPPTSDVPNRSGEDPHEAPRRAPWGQVQKSNFLSVGGLVTNPQPGGAPYFAGCWDGISGL